MGIPYSPPEYVFRDDDDDPPDPEWRFQCAVWELIAAYVDDLNVAEMRSVLTEVIAEYDYVTAPDFLKDRPPRKLDS